ncbi:MAG TPA: capsule assembly Wzi family protein [Candidatus Acidoferrum sp.]|jgi:membrane-associated phospholipid phosphatase
MISKSHWGLGSSLVVLAILLLVAGIALGQEQDPIATGKNTNMNAPQQKNDQEPQTESPSSNAVPVAKRNWAVQLMKDFGGDQVSIWTSPKNLRFSDASWLIPVGGITSALIVTDATYSNHISHNPSTMSHYNTLSTAGVAALAGGAGAMWVLSYKNHNSHWRETGFLAGEAAINTFVVTEAVKYGFSRDRPIQGNGNGDFFANGVSFPSEHSSVAWAIAGVVAHEYPGPIPKILAYGLAGLVSYSRLRARQHFPSDVFVGGIIGDMIAQNVYSRHHDPELGGEEWQSISQYFRNHLHPSAGSAGTPFVPLDSWVYPAIERLAARGLVHSEFLGLRPWTRIACANFTNEAAESLEERPDTTQMDGIVADLRAEFAAEFAAYENGPENIAKVESVYTRVMGISGTPLTDSYHFGQTITNDNGRPYQEGINNVTGFSAYTNFSRFSIFVDGEYQHAPSAAGYPLSVRQVIANVDQNPLQPYQPVATTNQFVIQQAYLSTNIESWNFSFGRQQLYWGPDYGSAFLFSDNALPIYTFRLSKITPFYLPWIMKYLGPMSIDLFFGRTQGNEFPPRPLMHGEKISFKPTENVTLGFSRTTTFGGEGRAMTPSAIFHSYFSFTSSFNYASWDNPGKRNGGFEFSYRLPFVRNWLTLYADSMTPDDPSPIDAPRRAAVNPGIYLSKFPHFNKLDFRVEGIYTDISTSRSNGGQYIYWETFYHDLYTNLGYIMGSWVGREGKGIQAWSTYWFNPKSSLQFAYRNQRVSSDFIPKGETIHDGSVNLNYWLNKEWNVSTLVQYEQWNAPVLATGLQKNWTSSVEVQYWPKNWKK